MPGRVLAAAAAASLLVALVVTGCGGAPAAPVATPRPGGPSVSDTPTTSAGTTDLTVVVDDGAGGTTTWTLTCDPAGGNHPDPAAACTILAAHGERALPPKGEDVACTEIYGGPEQATVTGTWRGQAVRSTFSRTDGCEISRWDLMQGLLPRAGG